MYDEFEEYEMRGKLDLEEIQSMFKPVRCTCGQIYDLGKVTVTARYADCSIWKAPCCGRQADDRGETGWKSTKDYYPIDKSDPYGVDARGRLRWA
jgi:hypothetical protein